MNKAKRMMLFISCLSSSPACSNAQEAVDRLADILNEVEDEFSGVAFNSKQWMDDGRMYPPEKDSQRATANPLVVCYRSRQHNTFIADNDAIRIETTCGDIILDKVGKDGRKVGDL